MTENIIFKTDTAQLGERVADLTAHVEALEGLADDPTLTDGQRQEVVMQIAALTRELEVLSVRYAVTRADTSAAADAVRRSDTADADRRSARQEVAP